MGNWKNRRRFLYQQYRDPASSYYNHRQPPPPVPGFAEDGVPSWEKKFCYLIGSVPWQKIVNCKKFMYCHDSVINWDDSAGEDAFQNAKERFWAETNRLPCQIPPLDPDMYIDEINWHPDIDPELVKDLDKAFFAPEEGEKDGNVECNNKSVPSEGWNSCIDEVTTPWECNEKMGSKASLTLTNKAWAWNPWHVNTNNCLNIRNGGASFGSCFPEENGAAEGKTLETSGHLSQRLNQSINHINTSKDWDICNSNKALDDISDRLWGWNHMGSQSDQLREWDSGCNPWQHSSCGVGPVKDKAWGNSSHVSWGNKKPELGKYNNGSNSWQSNLTQDNQIPNNILSRSSWENEREWRRWDSPNKKQKDLHFRQLKIGQRAWNDYGWRKREGSQHYVTGNKHISFHGNDYQGGHQLKGDYQSGHQWKGGSTKKRTSFA